MSSLRVVCILIFLPGAISLISVNTPAELTGTVGGDLEIPCKWSVPPGDGASPSSEVILQWFIETDSGERRRVFYKKGSTELLETPAGYARELLVKHDFTIVLRNATPHDARAYVCQVTAAPGGTEDSTTRVTVRDVITPEFELPEDGVVITQEKHATVGTCIARRGYPQPTITWHRGNDTVVTSADFILQETVTKEANELYTIRSTMLFRQRSFANATFLCRVRHGVPARPSVRASGRVTAVHEGKPELPHRYVLVPNVKTHTSLLCEATGNPTPNISWNITGSPTERWSAESKMLSSRLALNARDLGAVTVVKCSAWNKHGWAETTFVVQKHEDALTVLLVASVTSVTILLVLVAVTALVHLKRNRKQYRAAATKPANALHKDPECC